MNATDHFVRYPLSARFTMHEGAGRHARHIRTLGGASDWRRRVLDRVGGAAVAAAGTRGWPSAPAWSWPVCHPTALVEALHDHLPDLALLAVAGPRQVGRERLSLLARRNGHTLVLKLGGPDGGIETEVQVLRLLTDDQLPGIATPRVIAAGVVDLAGPVAFHVTEPLGLRRQRPAIDEPLRTFEADLAERLQSLPRPVGTPSPAVPTHGDLTPWNLRRTGRGLALFDWEAAAWRSPGSDLALYRSTSAEVRARRRWTVS
jgi:hypothetical protein